MQQVPQEEEEEQLYSRPSKKIKLSYVSESPNFSVHCFLNVSLIAPFFISPNGYIQNRVLMQEKLLECYSYLTFATPSLQEMYCFNLNVLRSIDPTFRMFLDVPYREGDEIKFQHVFLQRPLDFFYGYSHFKMELLKSCLNKHFLKLIEYILPFFNPQELQFVQENIKTHKLEWFGNNNTNPYLDFINKNDNDY
ncbi:hypothetical protein CYY_000273 [Polysphondylium violaceum]|uniref:Uncharacterized protein n=1 Tax=Polysphondylium violaceum TaxID=133409 RepID=A0A8J4UXB2_9MYCE|nr:hypothetical protein CYY_000273 [Polysphondylium violaceum]